MVPGGSACNTIVGVARLGHSAHFVGKRGNDEAGAFFEKALCDGGVIPVLGQSATPTGRVVSVITPDAQRTMFTSLGASSETLPSELSADKFKGASIIHIEGYLLFNRDLFFAALNAARDAGALVSLDLASFTVVDACRDMIYDAVSEYVDILIANEDEARAYTGISNEDEALELLSRDATLAVLKQGKRGAIIKVDGKKYQIPISGSGEALDTTGAGDLWAAGFLTGLVSGFTVEKCGALAAACGGEVCRVIGAHIPDDGWDRIRKVIA
jgi:sugar/nucleoside kinase (ribokinase family)